MKNQIKRLTFGAVALTTSLASGQSHEFFSGTWVGIQYAGDKSHKDIFEANLHLNYGYRISQPLQLLFRWDYEYHYDKVGVGSVKTDSSLMATGLRYNLGASDHNPGLLFVAIYGGLYASNRKPPDLQARPAYGLSVGGRLRITDNVFYSPEIHSINAAGLDLMVQVVPVQFSIVF